MNRNDGSYILQNREIVSATYEERAVWMREPGNARVALTEIGDGVKVSTVFLGEDTAHGCGHSGPPFLFETMVIGGARNLEGERSRTWANAEAAHARWVEALS